MSPGNDETDHHLLAVRRRLHDLEAAVEQHIEGGRGLPLLEHSRSLRNPQRGRARDDLVELGGVHGAEHRERLDQAAMKDRHA